MDWLRLYTNVLDNPKLQRLSGDQFKAVVNLWCLARIHDGTLPPVSDVAFRLRCTEMQAEELIEYLIDKKILDRADGSIVPHDWAEHQYTSDSSTERVKKHRKLKLEREETEAKRFSNVIEQNRADTEQSRTEQIQTSVRAALPTLRRPTADDLNGQASQRFEDWFSIWAGVRGNAYRVQACQQYLSVVLLPREADAMACVQSYVAGPGFDPSHGYRPDNFLREMAADSFRTRWPARQAAPRRQETPTEAAIRKAKEAQNGTR